MPREKAFDADQALARAMEAFWARGYEATSMRDLVDCMGVNRGSLYATFGDKRNLFLLALRRYDAMHRRHWLRNLAEERGPKDAILAVFQGAVDAVVNGGSRDGCLLVNTAVERSAHDEEIEGIIARSFKEIQTFFRDMLRKAQTAGEIPETVDCCERADALLALLLGLRVLVRSRPERGLLRSVFRQAEALTH